MVKRSWVRNLAVTSTIVACSFASAPASAETLREALAAAYNSNPTLAGARAGQRATDETVAIAKADGRPNISTDATYSENFQRSANSFTSPFRQFGANITLSVPIYSGGAVKNAVRAANKRVKAGQANLRATEASVFSSTVASYMDVMRDEATVRLSRANVGVLQVNLQATKDRFEIGDLTRTDVAQSEARLATSKSSLETAQANLIRSKETYIQLVGRVPLNLASPPPLPNLPKSPDEAVQIALDANPDLQAAKQNREAGRFDIKRARAARRPTLSAFTQGNYTNFLNTLGGGGAAAGRFVQQQGTAQAGLRATMPIYSGGRPAAQIRQAQARLGQALEQEIAVERNVIAQTRAAYASWRASNQVIASSERAVAANTLSLEGVRAENSVGNRSILDILNAEQELLNAQVQLVVARRNAYVAGFSLLAAMGRAEARDLGLDGGALYDPEVNFKRARRQISDYQSDKNPEAKSTRTVDTPAQKAEIAPLTKK